jgi:hypothetical protein
VLFCCLCLIFLFPISIGMSGYFGTGPLLSYSVFMPKPCTHRMHDPGSIVPHIRPKVFTDNQMSQIKYNYYYINSVLKTMSTLSGMEQRKTP